MENPITRLNKLNKRNIILKYILAVFVFAFILTVIFTNNHINEKVYIYKNLLIHGNEKEQKNEQKIKELGNGIA